MPTLVHNVETLYDVYLAANDKYDNQRFCCISGQIKNPGVFRVPNDASLEDILRTTKNFPGFDFFAQVGGSISGPVFNKSQLAKEKLTGAGSIEIYKSNVSPAKVLNKWFKFYHEESCGKCTPCREGTYQLYQLVKDKKIIPWKKIMPILDTLEATSFCALGKSVAIPVKSYLKNVLKKSPKK